MRQSARWIQIRVGLGVVRKVHTHSSGWLVGFPTGKAWRVIQKSHGAITENAACGSDPPEPGQGPCETTRKHSL